MDNIIIDNAIETIAPMNDIDAERFLQIIRDANAECDRMVAWYEQKIEEAKLARDRAVSYAETNLRVFMDYVPARETKTQKSYELPSGRLVLKHQEPKFETNDAELVPWLKANRPEFVKTKEYSDWSGLKGTLQLGPGGACMVTNDGEIVPGVEVTPREDKFIVTVH